MKTEGFLTIARAIDRNGDH